MAPHDQHTNALLQISKTVQTMKRASDLEHVVRIFFNEIVKIGIDVQALAVHRMLDTKTRQVETYRHNKNGAVNTAVRRKSTSLTKKWKSNAISYNANIEKSRSTEWVANMRQRLGGMQVISYVDIPFSQGVISAHSIRSNALSNDDIDILKQIAEILSTGFARVEDLTDLEQQTQELKNKDQQSKALLKISTAVQAMKNATDLNQVLQVFLDAINMIGMDVQALAVHRILDPTKRQVETYRLNLTGAIDSALQRKSTQLTSLWKNNTIAHAPDINADYPPEWITDIRARLNLPIASVLDIPFSQGVISMHSIHPHAFSDNDIVILKQIAEILSLGFARLVDLIDLEKQTQELRQSEQLLELRVDERTEELQKTNKLLKAEMRIRQESEEQLRQAQKMDAIGQLAGGIAHDFNNLLTVIKGYSNNVLKKLDPISDPLYADISEIAKASDKATILTDQLLSFGRRQILRPEILDVNHLLVQTQPMLRSLIPERIHLSMIFNSATSYVKADPDQLNQVIINLALNARDAMQQTGELAIKITNVSLDAPFAERFDNIQTGAFVRISVSDTGTGINPDILPHIFDPFFTTKEPGTGTGLGLSMAYGLINQSKGCIDVETTLGKGTTLHIYLPRSQEKPAPQETPMPTEHEETSPPGTETILLVEDDEMVRTLAKQTLERQGYHVLEARDGKLGVHMIQAFGPEIDLILTDVVMPDTSGPELVKQAQQICPNIKAVFISGHAPSEISKHPLLETNIPFVRKPFSPKALTHQIRKTLDP